MYSAHKKVYLEMGILMVVICIIAAMFFVPQILSTKNKFTAQENLNLIKVAAGGCSYDSGKNYAQGDTVNSRDGKINPGTTPEAYDMSRYEFIKATDGKLDISGAYDNVPDHNGNVEPQMGSILGFNAKSAVAAYYLKDKGGQQKYPVLEFATSAGQDIKIPVSGYNTLYGFDSKGSGPEGNIMWASDTALAFQIGRADDVSKNYWIYIKDVCVDKALVRAYQAADAGGRRTLPEVYSGDVVAKANGNVQIGIRDSGAFIEIRHTRLWAGSWSASAPSADSSGSTGSTGSTGSSGSSGGSPVASPEAKISPKSSNLEACGAGVFCDNSIGLFCNAGSCSEATLNRKLNFVGEFSKLPNDTDYTKLSLAPFIVYTNNAKTIELPNQIITNQKFNFFVQIDNILGISSCGVKLYSAGKLVKAVKSNLLSDERCAQIGQVALESNELPQVALTALPNTGETVGDKDAIKFIAQISGLPPDVPVEKYKTTITYYNGSSSIEASSLNLSQNGNIVAFFPAQSTAQIKKMYADKTGICFFYFFMEAGEERHFPKCKLTGNTLDFGTLTLTSDDIALIKKKTQNQTASAATPQVVYVYPAAQFKKMSATSLATFSATKNVKAVVEGVDGTSVNADFVDVDGAGNITVKFTPPSASFQLKNVKTLDNTGNSAGFSLVQNSKL